MEFFSLRCPFHVFVLGATTAGTIAYVVHLFNRETESLNEKSSKVVDISKRSVGRRYKTELRVATECALKAGANILRAIDETKVVDLKGVNDFVTETDKANEILVYETLHRNFPTYLFIGEVKPSQEFWCFSISLL